MLINSKSLITEKEIPGLVTVKSFSVPPRLLYGSGTFKGAKKFRFHFVFPFGKILHFLRKTKSKVRWNSSHKKKKSV